MSYKKMIFTGTLILTLSGFLARILGFYNRIFLSNLIGAKELGIYQLIFPIYMLCFSLCCHGFETGISNLTSRFFAKGQKKNAHHLVRLGCLLSFCLSILLMFALFEGADYLSTFILKEASAAPSLKIAALSLPFVSIKACLHGYYIGLNHSSVPAVSQIVEQITRVGGIYLLSISVFIMGADARIAAWGMVLGEAVSTIYTILAYFHTLFFENSIFFQKNLQKNNSNKNKQNKKTSNTQNQNKRISNKNNSDRILKNYNKKYSDKRTFSRQEDSFTLSTGELLEHFFSFSIPISVNHFCLTIISSLETMLIPFMLEIFFHSHSQALETYGTLTGMALPFLFFPATIVNSLSVMLMPAISSAYDQKQHRQMENTISVSLHFCLLIGIFSTFAFLIYGTVLGETIFHSKEAGQYVYLFSVLCPFMYAAQTTSSILNGFGKTKQTLYHNLLGVGIRIFFILLLIPSKGIPGYLIGLLAGYSLQLLLNLFRIYQIVPFYFSAEKTLLFPVITAIGGGILSKKFWGIASAALPLSSFYILAISGFLYFLFFTLCQIFRESV